MTAEPGDSNLKRDIWILGFRDSDERPDKALCRVFGMDKSRARRLIARMPSVVKREVTAEQAEPFLAALRKMGARVALVPTGASSPGGAMAPPGRPEAQTSPDPSAALPPTESGGGLPTAASFADLPPADSLADLPPADSFADLPPLDAPASSLAPSSSAAPALATKPAIMPPARTSSDGLGDIASLGIDFGASGLPGAGTHPAPSSVPAPRISSPRPPRPATSARPGSNPAQASTPSRQPTAVAFLEPRAIPKRPEAPTTKGMLTARLVALIASGAGGAALFFASQLSGSAFSNAPSIVGCAATAAAVALLLYGMQASVAAFVFAADLRQGGALTLAILLGGAVGASAYAAHWVSPEERAQQRRERALQAIRDGRLPEARTFLSEPNAQLANMSAEEASAWVEAIYAAGARQVYVEIDYSASRDHGVGLAVGLPLTETRRNAVNEAVRQRGQGREAQGEWLLVNLE